MTARFAGGFGLANGDVLIFGMRGNIYKSSNGGKNWQKSDSKADQSITGGMQLADGRIVLTGLSGIVLVSTDNGASFTGGTRRPTGQASPLLPVAKMTRCCCWVILACETHSIK